MLSSGFELEPVQTDVLIGAWSQSATPPPSLTVSEWADSHRHLPESSSARGGRWRTDAVPYLRGIMDAVHEPGVSKIALRKCAQVGGSESAHNIMAYHIVYDPCPMLVVHPTENNAEEWSKDRLADLIRSTPALKDAIRTKRKARDAHRGESTLTYKTFPGGYIAMGGANTENTFARRSVRIAFGDDVDRFPPVVGQEGDPADLLAKRTEMWEDGLVIMVSTPSLKGGRIDSMFARGDQRHFHVQCPDCGRWDYMTWSDTRHFSVAYEDRDPTTARLQCAETDHGGCAGRFDEPTRRRMVMGGEWRATAVAKEPGLVSFHLPAMVTTLGKASLTTWVSDWISARERGKESTRVFINTTLGEGWEDRGAKMEPQTLISRKESYGDGIEVPAFASVLTCGVDVQLDRFELQVLGFGLAGERAVVDYRIINADPRSPEAQGALLEALGRTYTHALGPQLPIRATCIDSGFWTDDIYEFVLKHHNEQSRPIYASKGVGGRSGSPIVGKRTEQKSGKSQRKIWLYPINTDDAKADIVGALSVVKPGPGYMHFPHLDTVNEEYFAQLCAEIRVTKYNRAKVATHQEWEKQRDRNEALDNAVMALAAFRILNPNLRQMAERIAEKSRAITAAAQREVEAAQPKATDYAAPPAVARPGRRVARSKYLG